MDVIVATVVAAIVVVVAPAGGTKVESAEKQAVAVGGWP